MTTKQQLATAEEILSIVKSITDQVIYDEATRVLNTFITLSQFIVDGEVKTITAACGKEMRYSLADLRNLVEHGVWTKPGDDIPAFVTTDDDGNYTADSELKLGGVQVIRVIGEHNRDLIGKPATKHMTQIIMAVRALGFTADFSNGVETLEFRKIGWHKTADRRSCGYSFAARHGRK